MKIDKSNVFEVLNSLTIQHPNAKCELDYTTNFELLIAVMLSAQCTDKRVNIVTKVLFNKYNTPQQFCEISQEELEKLIFSCGFYHNKAKNIISASKDICLRFNGVVPNNLKDLQSLAGVGKKTANVVFAEGFGGQAIAVDTHLLRVSDRLGIDNSKNPLKVEKTLNDLIPKSMWSKSHHLFIFHGRYICLARNPKCEECKIKDYCNFYNK